MESESKKKNVLKKWWFWLIVIVIIVAVANSNSKNKNTASTASSSNKGTSSQTTKADTKPAAKEKKYSLSKFMQISMGMSYGQVKNILGDGVEESSSGDGDLKTISYSWKNDDASNLSVMLQGDKVINKAQALLESMDAKVTLDKYNKISNGMTYDQVKAILGEGQLTSQGELLDVKTEIYSWINSDGSNMEITFQGGKVDSKAQFELK